MRVSPHKASLFPQTKRILAIKYDNMTARDLSPPLFRERKRRKELISPDDGNYEESNLCPKIGKRVCGRSPSSAKRKEAVYDEERSNKCRRTDVSETLIFNCWLLKLNYHPKLRDVTLEFPATTLQVEVQLDPPLRGVQGHVLSKEVDGVVTPSSS